MTAIHIDEHEIPAGVLTLDGFRRWYGSLPEGQAPSLRASFVQGTVFIETRGQSLRTHEPVVRQVNAALMTLENRSRAGIYYWPPSWFTCDEAGVSTEPDGMFSTNESLRAGILRIHPEHEHELVGRPDFVFEAVSRSSAQKDHRELREAYAKAGIPEYWIADGRRKELRLVILLLGPDGDYREQVPDADGFLHSPTWGRSFRLCRCVNDAGLDDIEVEMRVP